MNSLGLAAFYKEHDEETKILFEEYIANMTSFKRYPLGIKQHRNLLIYLTFFQIISSFFGMCYIVFRRSYIYLLINLVSLFLAACGLYGSIRFHSISLIIHCIFSISIIGAFFIYQILDLLLIQDTSYTNQRRFNDSLILFIFSLPYLYDFCVGVYNYLLLKKVSLFNFSFNKEKELLKTNYLSEYNEMNKKYSLQDIEKHLSNVDSKICIICVERNRNTVLNPCGHVLCCEDCAKNIFNNGRFNMISEIKCPICRTKCRNFLKIIIS